ncbi:hypothetical protein B0H17DRAFT_282814 [Mycena rosella]|uniref:Uncharacterized protein n=1 Tax=Mycena rosella TaxID=1033263 RepID=A0AAD7CWA9_MYCRO|nr:hypothetical protein B0H17DRAFT_282814 [Mycena rosella]
MGLILAVPRHCTVFAFSLFGDVPSSQPGNPRRFVSDIDSQCLVARYTSFLPPPHIRSNFQTIIETCQSAPPLSCATVRDSSCSAQNASRPCHTYICTRIPSEAPTIARVFLIHPIVLFLSRPAAIHSYSMDIFSNRLPRSRTT